MVNRIKNIPHAAEPMILAYFILRFMKSSSFTAKTFLVLLFQTAKAKEKSNSKLKIKTFKPMQFNFFINKVPGLICLIKLEITTVAKCLKTVLLVNIMVISDREK